MPRATSDPTPRQRGGKSYVVTLKSGGSVRVTVDIDPFALNNGDRAFVFELVDQVTKYEQKSAANARRRPLEHAELPDTPEAEASQPEHTQV